MAKQDRDDRLKNALRANLQRRKQKARAKTVEENGVEESKDIGRSLTKKDK